MTLLMSYTSTRQATNESRAAQRGAYQIYTCGGAIILISLSSQTRLSVRVIQLHTMNFDHSTAKWVLVQTSAIL